MSKQMTRDGAGMGTSGFVGQFFTFTSMGFSWEILFYIAVLHFIAPAVLCFFISDYFRKKGWITFGEMTIKHQNWPSGHQYERLLKQAVPARFFICSGKSGVRTFPIDAEMVYLILHHRMISYIFVQPVVLTAYSVLFTNS